MKPLREKLTYANVVSTICLFLLLGGASAFAASQIAKNSVGANQLKKNAVTAAKLKNGAVTGAKVKDGSLTGADLAAASIGAAQLGANAVTTGQIANNAVNGAKIANNAVTSAKIADKTITGKDVADNTLTGTNINESTLGKVPEAEKLNGKTSTEFLSRTIYKNESPVEAGVDKGEGTFAINQACNPGDVLLSGGPANIAATSVMLESFSTPGDINSWTVRIKKNVEPDNWSVVVLCVKQ